MEGKDIYILLMLAVYAPLAAPCSQAQADPVCRIATETRPVRNTISGFPLFMDQGLSILGDMRAISIYASFLAGPWMIGSNSRSGSSSRFLHSSESSLDANLVKSGSSVTHQRRLYSL